jgi:uncharacterized protein YggE
VLAASQSLNVHAVTWHVDWDNPAWPQARAAAIQAAIHKGRDYAAALGGTLQHIEHVADAGLLGGESAAYQPLSRAQRAVSASADGPGTPGLNPVPQELIATIDARFRTTAVSLPGT